MAKTLAKKTFLVSEDEYSGQVVIVCEVEEVEVDTYVPTEADLSAAMYLYREIPKNIEKKIRYTVKVFYHYELGEYAYIPNGDGCRNELVCWRTYDKNEANEYYKEAVAYCK